MGAWPSRSTLDLLDRPLVFSQQDLLPPSEFTRFASTRGIDVREEHLEQLHRRRVLVPFFEILNKASSKWSRITVEGGIVGGSDIQRIYGAASDGRLADPASRSFQRWRREDRGRRFFYSPYQIVGLYELAPILGLIEARWGPEGRYHADLEPIDRAARESAKRGRDLAIALAALDAAYSPRVHGVVRHPDEWDAVFEQHDPGAHLAFLGVEPELLTQQAERLLLRAAAFDPLDGWIELVRNANDAAWDELGGDARHALDYRIAAELLLLLYDDLAFARDGVSLGPTSPTPLSVNGTRGRLFPAPGELDETLNRFGLSPHSAVVMAIEGPSEARIVPRLLEAAGIDPRSHFAELVELQGGGNDAGVIARLVVPPRFRDEHNDFGMLRRPLTHVAVVVDPDSKWAQVGARESIVDSIMACLSSRLRTDRMRGQIDQLVTVHTWASERGPFEFAHFTDDQLADAVMAVTGGRFRVDRSQLLAAIRAQRASPHPDIERACQRIARGVSKPDLAEALWAALEPRVRTALERGLDEPPLVRIVRDVIMEGLKTRRATAVEL